MKSFFRFFAERHILATLIVVMVLILGLSTVMKIKRDSYPNVSYGVMVISTRYPGASAEDVELNVTNKIEEELKSVVGIDYFTSFSMENVSVVLVVIDINEKNQDKLIIILTIFFLSQSLLILCQDFEFGLYFQPNYSMIRIKIDNDSDISQLIYDTQKERNKCTIGYDIGLGLAYIFQTNFTISTGINYSNKGY